MTPKVVVVDAGLGNVRSVQHALERAGSSAEICATPEELVSAERAVMPGQGAFGDGMRALDGEWGDALRRYLQTGRPFFGICLGMQLLFESSEEAPGVAGLALAPGCVRRFQGPQFGRGDLKVPHMGWNQVQTTHPWLRDGAWYYFDHSYYCEPTSDDECAGWTEHGLRFCAAIAVDNIFACQFHPEKSQAAGQHLLSAFLNEDS